MLSQNEMIRRLQALPKDRKVKISSDKTHAWMVCFFHFRNPGERESTPSFKVNLQRNGKYNIGTGRCFSCSKYISKFEAVLDPSKEDTTEQNLEEEDEYIQSLYNDTLDPILYDEEDKPIDIPNPIPWTVDDWRSIPANIMRDIKAQLIYDEEYDNLMAYLPCMVQGKHIGGIRANLEKKGKRNYFNTKGSWLKNKGLFPYDYTVDFMKNNDLETIVLSEGPRDALRALKFGIPTMSILGCSNWSENKVELILNLQPKRIITAMDGDAAGKKATKEIHESFKGEAEIYDFKLSKFGKDLDLGNASIGVMEKLKSFIV